MRRVFKITGAFLLSAILYMNTACSLFPDGNINDEVNDDNRDVAITEGESKHVEGTLVGDVTIDADVKIPSDAEWKQYNLIKRKISREKADENVKLFAAGREYAEPEFMDYDNIKRYYYWFDDGSLFIDGEDSVQYDKGDETEKNYHRFAGYRRDDGVWTDKEEAFPQKSLSGCDLNAAIEQVKDMCRKLNIEINEDEPDVYVMDAVSINKQVKKINENDGRKPGDERTLKEWSEDDEVYYIIFEMMLNGIEMESGSIETESKRSHPRWVTAAIGRDGMRQFDAQRLYETENEQELEGSVCSLDEAMDVVAAQLQYLTGRSEYSISAIELKYMSLANRDWTEYYIRPYWVFTTVNKTTRYKDGVADEEVSTQKLFVDAVKKTFYIGR